MSRPELGVAVEYAEKADWPASLPAPVLEDLLR